ncbi:MAG: tetratricopeptide repeat protein [Thermodesulfobacteriota bacterium]
MKTRVYSKTISIVFLFFSLLFMISCQQTKDFSSELTEDLPNPVSDFTENDNYKIGLKWYQQGEYRIAKKMWLPMARGGDCDAEYAIGLLYFDGLGIRKNRDTALRWWIRAANQAQPQALNTMGVVFAHRSVPYTRLNCKKGCGEPRDLVEAYKWFGLAEKYGPPREVQFAQKSMNRISIDMSNVQIKEAKVLIDEWQPEPAKCRSRDLIIVSLSQTFIP